MTDEVLIIGEPRDGVARRLATALTDRGHRAVWLDGPAAARLFTVRVTAARDTVQPDLPMFVRPVSWSDAGVEPTVDTRFIANERYAAFWAAAALSPRAVINRPDPSGPVYRLTAGALGANHASSHEIHASGPERIPEDCGDFWGEGADFRVAALASLTATPVRARRVDVAIGYEIVTVVGDKAFVATTDRRSTDHDLAARSIALARRFKVHFATLTWAVTHSAAKAVRLNAAPDDSELRYRWADVLDALCRDLLT